MIVLKSMVTTLVCLFAVCPHCGEQPQTTQSSALNEALSRIEELEKRVAELTEKDKLHLEPYETLVVVDGREHKFRYATTNELEIRSTPRGGRRDGGFSVRAFWAVGGQYQQWEDIATESIVITVPKARRDH